MRTRTPASENADEQIVDNAIKAKPRLPKKQKVVTQTYRNTPTLPNLGAISIINVLCLLSSLRTPLSCLLQDYKKLPEQQKNEALIADAQEGLKELENMIAELKKV